ncbi:BcsE family c-di-GMP-binding protein [Pistricoccus aurantiacus]|uniref:BcsE family c-di-GMP-binding protein n=1 Tax=Pistricoccus aurantiacus TaxID=1883414 RepID=UPI003643D4EF
MPVVQSSLGVPWRRHHFSLGIDQASPEPNALRCPGFYAVVADSPVQAERLVRGVMQAQSAQLRVDWLAPGKRAREGVESLPPDSGPGTLAYWSLPVNQLQEALLALPEDFSGVRRKGGQPRLIVLDVPAKALIALKPNHLRRWCWRWRLWLVQRNCCLLLLAQGEHGLALRERLEGCNDAIDGLLHLQPSDEGAYCHLLHWRSDFGVTGVDDMLLTVTAEGWRRQSAATVTSGGSPDEHVYLVQSAMLKGSDDVTGHYAPGHWNIIDSLDEVLAQAARAHAATVVVAVEAARQIEPLARRLYHLRKTRGSALKLVVCELTPCLRYRDERLLLLCGTSMVAKFGLSFSDFLSRIEAIQGQRFTRPVTDDLEALFEAFHPRIPGGRCAPAQFLEAVGQWLEGDATALVGSLMIVLTPAGSLTPEQLVAQARLQRQGDLLSLMEGRLYLFLFGCRRSASDAALQSLFGLPANALFLERREFDEPAAIAEEVQRLARLGWSRQQRLPEIPDPPVLFGDETTQQAYRPRPAALKVSRRAAG